MSTVLYNPIVVNPQAYLVFPGLYELIPNTTDYIEYCTYTGILEIHIDNQLVKQYEHTDSIDLSEFVNSQIRISLVTEQGSVLLGEWIIDESRIAIPESIRKNLVVWYDVAKQNATNESMQANPVLKDFSGNGRDATCYNFAWAGKSGIGGFAYGSGYWRKTYPEGNRGHVYIFSSAYPSTKNRPEFSFTVKGLTDLYNQDNTQFLSLKAYYQHDNTSDILIDHKITQDGHYSFRTDNIENFTFWSLGKSGYGNDSTKLIPFDIEVIEDMMYPGALVYDGVDDKTITDKGMFSGLQFDDYTVLWKRVNNGNSIPERGFRGIMFGGIFANEEIEKNERGIWFLSLGRQTAIGTENEAYEEVLNTYNHPCITYQVKDSFNGIADLNYGDTPIIADNDTRLSVGTWSLSESSTDVFYGALYSLLLFDRRLSPAEIDWVKTNLIEQ